MLLRQVIKLERAFGDTAISARWRTRAQELAECDGCDAEELLALSAEQIEPPLSHEEWITLIAGEDCA
jgi:hypothetical protein